MVPVAAISPWRIQVIRNPVLSYFSAERLMFVYARQGIEGVRAEIQLLRGMNLI